MEGRAYGVIERKIQQVKNRVRAQHVVSLPYSSLTYRLLQWLVEYYVGRINLGPVRATLERSRDVVMTITYRGPDATTTGGGSITPCTLGADGIIGRSRG